MATKLRIRAEKIEATHLAPGDLFSQHGPEFWHPEAFGHDASTQVNIRLEGSLPKNLLNETVYRITVLGQYHDTNPNKFKFTMDPHNPPGVKEKR